MSTLFRRHPWFMLFLLLVLWFSLGGCMAGMHQLTSTEVLPSLRA
jgi:hypothetical protein